MTVRAAREYPMTAFVLRARCSSALPACAVAVLTAAALGGCAGGGASGSVGLNALAPAATPPAASQHASTSTSSTNAVAVIGGVPITKPMYEHWLAIERAHGAAGNARRAALGFLVTYEWVVGEAAARHITVSEAELKKRLAKLDKQSFPKPGALHRFMASTGETEADLEAILRVQLLKNQIAAKVTAGDVGPKAQEALAAFQKAFQAHWKRYTSCGKQYVMEDCSQSK